MGEIVKPKDPEFMSRKEHKAEIRRLRAAITKVVTQRGDDICWRDVYTELAALVGVDPTPHLINDKEKMLANCDRFCNSLMDGPYIPVYVEKRVDVNSPIPTPGQ